MPAPYSEDLREKIIQAVEEGKLSKPQIALLFNVSKHFIYTLCDLHKNTGSVSPKKMGGYVKPKIDPKGEVLIQTWLTKEPCLSLPELCAKYQDNVGIKLGTSSMGRTLKRRGISRKKRVRTTLKNTKIESSS